MVLRGELFYVRLVYNSLQSDFAKSGELLLARGALEINFLLRLVIVNVVTQLKKIILVGHIAGASLCHRKWDNLRDTVNKRRRTVKFIERKATVGEKADDQNGKHRNGNADDA